MLPIVDQESCGRVSEASNARHRWMSVVGAFALIGGVAMASAAYTASKTVILIAAPVTTTASVSAKSNLPGRQRVMPRIPGANSQLNGHLVGAMPMPPFAKPQVKAASMSSDVHELDITTSWKTAIGVIMVLGLAVRTMARRSAGIIAQPLLPLCSQTDVNTQAWSMATVAGEPGSTKKEYQMDQWTPLQIPESPQELAEMLRNPSTREYFSDPKNVQYLGYQAARTGFFTTLSLAGRVGRAVRRQVKGADAGEDIIPSQFTSGLPRFAGSAAEMLRRDLDNISKGIYRAPYDMDPTHRQASPIFVLEQLKNFVDSAIDGSDRQMRKGAFEVRDSSKNLQGYPDYYLQNFHWTGGWMSADSAKQYELGTEAVFVGLQDAMQRHYRQTFQVAEIGSSYIIILPGQLDIHAMQNLHGSHQ